MPRSRAGFKVGIEAFTIPTFNSVHLVTPTRNCWVVLHPSSGMGQAGKFLGKGISTGKKIPGIFFTPLSIFIRKIFLFFSHLPHKTNGGNREYLRELVRKAPRHFLGELLRI